MTFKEAIRHAGGHRDRLRQPVPRGVRDKGRVVARGSSVRYTAADRAACLRVPDGKNLRGWSVIPVIGGMGCGT